MDFAGSADDVEAAAPVPDGLLASLLASSALLSSVLLGSFDLSVLIESPGLVVTGVCSTGSAFVRMARAAADSPLDDD